jgi:hypothetical protein
MDPIADQFRPLRMMPWKLDPIGSGSDPAVPGIPSQEPGQTLSKSFLRLDHHVRLAP